MQASLLASYRESEPDSSREGCALSRRAMWSPVWARRGAKAKPTPRSPAPGGLAMSVSRRKRLLAAVASLISVLTVMDLNLLRTTRWLRPTRWGVAAVAAGGAAGACGSAGGGAGGV